MGWFESSKFSQVGSTRSLLIDLLGNTEVYKEFENYNQNSGNQEHHAKLSHEIIGGAAAYEAAKAYEDHVAKNGETNSLYPTRQY